MSCSEVARMLVRTAVLLAATLQPAPALSEDLNHPPTCSSVVATPSRIFPPRANHFTRISLTGATDPDGDPVTISVIGVYQDEPVTGNGDDTAPDARGAAGHQVSVRQERNPHGNGRVYRISFQLHDNNGATCSVFAADTNAKVSVPRRRNDHAVDDYPTSFDSYATR